jgi:hypothetical protein
MATRYTGDDLELYALHRLADDAQVERIAAVNLRWSPGPAVEDASQPMDSIEGPDAVFIRLWRAAAP